MNSRVAAARSTLAVVFSIGLLLVLTLPVAAKQQSATVTVCQTGDDLTISIVWVGERADSWNYGWGNDEGGLGITEPLAHPTGRGSETHTFVGAAPDADFAGAGLSFRDVEGSSDVPNRPDTGWAAC